MEPSRFFGGAPWKRPSNSTRMHTFLVSLFGLDPHMVYFSFCFLLISLCSLDLPYFIRMVSVRGPWMACCSNEDCQIVCGIVFLHVFIHRHTHTHVPVLYAPLFYKLTPRFILCSSLFPCQCKGIEGDIPGHDSISGKGPCYASQEQATPDTITNNVTCWLTFLRGG